MQVNVKNSYIQFLNNFWQVSKTANFSTTEIALYFYLLDINNSCRWLNSFNHNNKAIEAALNISFKTLAKARDKLYEVGLISFITKNGSPNVSYQVLTTHLTYGNFPKVSTEVRDEINKIEIKSNNIIEVVIGFDGYKEFLKSEESHEIREAIYNLYGLKKGSLEKLSDEFEKFQKAKGNSLNTSIEKHHNHFVNWINKKENVGQLNNYKVHTHKKNGAL